MPRVKASQPGYYGCLREAGDEFDIADPSKEVRGGKEVVVDPFSQNWMERIEKPAKSDTKPAKG